MLLLIVFIIALVFSFLLSGLETAVLSVSRVRVKHAADDKDKRAAELLPLMDGRDGLLGSLTIANHVANVAAFGYITWQLVRHWGTPGYLIGFLLALPLFIIGLEVLPKNLFRRYPYRMLLRFLPVLRVAGKFRGLFHTIPTPKAFSEEAANIAQAARDDMSHLLDDMVRQKLVPASAAEIAKRVLSSRPVTAREVMIPLSQVMCVEADTPAQAAATLGREKNFSYLLVKEQHRVIGILATTSLPADIPPDRQVRQHTRPIDHVDSLTPALGVLQRLRRRSTSLALVTTGPDQTPTGMITEEDIVATLLPLRAADVV